MNIDEAAAAFREFVAVVKALRTPGTGCPWDLEQTHRTLRPYLVEEAHEALEAIDRGDDQALREELGDVLLQVVLHAQLGDDRQIFSITDVVRGITEKMVRRHPHVFGSVAVYSSAEVLRNWEQIKAAERQASGKTSDACPLARVPEGLPALMRAQRLGSRAAKEKPEEASLQNVLSDLHREFDRLDEAARAGSGDAAIEERMGDILFTLCQLARRLGVDAEASLRGANRRFVEGYPAQP
ncbi:hypothetical protein AYO44_09370 [Planctomycetaceae bacterium SCGC AG-212-F19]|nr:hypothetical protein AYO44_09370 [Planctomycetaceae bacterium SCGC AG-212-F19]